MKRFWWLIFGRAYIRGYKAGLTDGEIACLERQIAKCELEASTILPAIKPQQDVSPTIH
jgi:hypothetical protein